MSEPSRGAAPDPRIVAVFGVVAWIAFVVAVFGIISLVIDIDVVRQEDAGPFLGPAMITAAAVVLGLLLVRIQRAAEPAGVSFVGCAAAVYIVMLLVGAIGYAAITGRIAQLLFFVLDYGLSPFVVAAAILAGLTGITVLAVVARGEGGGRPRWPWEDRNEP